MIEQSILQRLADKRAALVDMESYWLQSKSYALPVVEKLAALGSEPYVYGTDFLYASLTGDVHTLTDAIRALRTGGFKASNGEKPERKSATFTAIYKHPEAKLGILLAFSSSVCRRVKVGTKTETVDVYEVQCGESDEFKAEGVETAVDDMPF